MRIQGIYLVLIAVLGTGCDVFSQSDIQYSGTYKLVRVETPAPNLEILLPKKLMITQKAEYSGGHFNHNLKFEDPANGRSFWAYLSSLTYQAPEFPLLTQDWAAYDGQVVGSKKVFEDNESCSLWEVHSLQLSPELTNPSPALVQEIYPDQIAYGDQELTLSQEQAQNPPRRDEAVEEWDHAAAEGVRIVLEYKVYPKLKTSGCKPEREIPSLEVRMTRLFYELDEEEASNKVFRDLPDLSPERRKIESERFSEFLKLD